ncbi:MAG: PEGA domain-containing protein [Pseudomonadota bacterium]
MMYDKDLDDRTVLVSEDGQTVRQRGTSVQPPYLVIVDGPRVGRRFPLRGNELVLGRGAAADIQFPDQSASRQHARLVLEGPSWAIEDLGSKNGTIVNNGKITEKVVIGHKDLVKIGIYLLRLITQETPSEEELKVPAEFVLGDRTIIAEVASHATDIPTQTEANKLKDVEESSKGEIPPAVKEASRFNIGPLFKYLVILLIACVGAASIYLGWRYFLHPEGEEVPQIENKTGGEVAALPVVKPVSPQDVVKPQQKEPTESLPELEQPTGMPPAQGAEAAARPVFLDFVSNPLPAKIIFEGKELGTTPLRANLELSPGKNYSASASFYMPSIGETYDLPTTFQIAENQQVIPILFKAPIGVLKVMDLPRDVELYLKGSFEYQKFKEKASKLEDVVLAKPAYLPYGTYSLELRRSKKMSESSPTIVEGIIYQRNFVIAKESPSFTIGVKEEDLQNFPVTVRTEPEATDVFVDGKKVGITPYEGAFPLGRHNLTLRKDGFFEHSEVLDVDINTPFEIEVAMQTSLAGAHLNNAKAAFRRGVYQTAIDELAEVLSSAPTDSETAFANLYLGKSYLQLKNNERAIGYFQPLQSDPEQKFAAQIGLVDCYASMGEKVKALTLLVEVLLKVKDESLRREANVLFQQLSPLQSVLYVYSEPTGAKVTVNGNDVGQVTPVILHELALGNYKILLEKDGYDPTQLNLNLTINEFNPVIVKLKPRKE